MKTTYHYHELVANAGILLKKTSAQTVSNVWWVPYKHFEKVINEGSSAV